MHKLDKNFLTLLMDKTGFPEEAKTSLSESAGKVDPQALEQALDAFYAGGFSIKDTQPAIDEMAKAAGLSPYTVWMVFLMQGAKHAKADYEKKGVSEDIFWDTFCDLRYKALECMENYGVWGTFVAFWYPIFFSCDIVKLGRLEYETAPYEGPEFTKAGVTVKPGDMVQNIHIPSSGEPFDAAARLASYKKAYEFFKPQGPLVCMCHSWLLFPEYKKILKPGSNIASFQEDFDIIKTDTGRFGDAWRVFGPEHDKPTEELPERTSMQRAFKGHLLAGGETGEGLGVLLFDGEKLL